MDFSITELIGQVKGYQLLVWVMIPLLAVLQVSADSGSGTAPSSATPSDKDARLAWWKEAKFGMFIHWGIYAIPAGVWKGKDYPQIGEWIMRRAEIPVTEYEQLTKQFNPVKFNADEWVQLAKNAGMKYIIITSKHHDGFAMYHSKVSKYNIVDATPFDRDPIKELADACAKHGLKFGLYYSHVQDWHEPGAVGNNWDFPESTDEQFAQYLEEKVKPQVREIMTEYGPIAAIWYDTPVRITKEQSQACVDLVHSLQPDCLVNGRVGHGLGDYQSRGDNEIPAGRVDTPWETPATLNDTWGFKVKDHNWKPTKLLIQQLVDIVSKGGNYLLNVGPTAEGIIPQPSVDRLLEVGQWLKTNGESVYGCNSNPFPYEFEWGAITTKPGKIYVHVYDWPTGVLMLYGIRNNIIAAHLLADPHKRPLGLRQRHVLGRDQHMMKIQLPPKAPDANDTVIVLYTSEALDVDTTPMQQPDGIITLEAYSGQCHSTPKGPHSRIGRRGIVENWHNTDHWLSWEFKVVESGEFDVVMLTSGRKISGNPDKNTLEATGHEIQIEVAGQKIKATCNIDGKTKISRDMYHEYYVSKLGRVKLPKAGKYQLELKALKIVEDAKKHGLRLRSIKLMPIEASK